MFAVAVLFFLATHYYDEEDVAQDNGNRFIPSMG